MCWVTGTHTQKRENKICTYMYSNICKRKRVPAERNKNLIEWFMSLICPAVLTYNLNVATWMGCFHFFVVMELCCIDNIFGVFSPSSADAGSGTTCWFSFSSMLFISGDDGKHEESSFECCFVYF